MFDARDWSGRRGSVISEVEGELVVVSPIADMLHFIET
jgi:hypothetical protein